MKRNPLLTLALLAALVYAGVAAFRHFRAPPGTTKTASAQQSATPADAAAGKATTSSNATNPSPVALTNAAPGISTNASSSALTNTSPAEATNALASAKTDGALKPVNGPGGPDGLPPGVQVAGKVGPGTNAPAGKDAEGAKAAETDEIALSFQGANVDMVVQWLAKTTGKSVVKHPRVQCQLTIVSSKKVTQREALNLVYRALALEGFNTIESSKEVIIVPEGQDPKISPEVLVGSKSEIPQGRQRLIKVFPLKFIQPGDLRDKVRPVLSEKATIDVDDRASQVIVTDYNENLRLIADLIKELDVTAASDIVIQIYPLQHSEAEDLTSLLSLILNAQAGSPSSGGSSRPSGGGSRSSGGPSPMPEGMMIGGPPPSSGGGGPPSSSSPSAGSQAGQQVKIWPDKTANRLIVSAPKSRLPEVEKLIGILDVDKPEDVGVRVIPLKNVSAEDLVKEIGPLYQKVSGKSLKETVEVTASSRANSVIVLSSEANFKALSKLIESLDTEEAQEKVMKAFALKNADAEDVAKQLKDLSQDQDSGRYPYYYFYGSSQNTKTSKKPSVVADRRRNTVIVQAPPSAMDGIAKMIETLDEPVAENALAPIIFRLKYVSASDIEDVLNELFLKKQQQRSYFFYYDDNPQETADKNVGRLYGKVRITSEPYSNSIIVTANSKESLDAVESVIKELDAPSEAGESTLRVSLKFAKATILANSINILFAKNGSPALRQTAQPGQPNPTPQQPAQPNSNSQSGFDLEKESKEEGYYPWLGGPPDNTRSTDGRNTIRPVSDLVGRVRAVADQRSNALLISANVHFFPQVLKLVADLDAPTEQVLIEARLVEISNDYLDKLGVRWSPDGSQTFTADDYDNSLLVHANSQYQTGFGGNTVVNTPSGNASQTSGGTIPLVQTLASLRSGVLGSTISMDYLVQFLRKTTDAKVLAEPQINIRDNETGRLFVGQQVPIPQNNVVSSLGGQSTGITYKDVGVTLEVTPHINTSGDVELSIHAESSTVVPGQTVLGGAVFDTRNFRTDLTAKNGQTLVLGGIIQKQVSDTLRKTPFLGDIPGLGWAFKKKDKTSREVELMVFMRPKVTQTPAQAQELLEEIYKKAPGMKQWNEDNSPNNEKDTKKGRGKN